jgi:GT2 family glycosyltransferase
MDAAVVVPTHNRSARLSLLLDGLAAQDDAGSIEVIVVDDASTDDTPTMLARRRAELPYELVALRQEHNQGPAAARNRGWRAARAPIVCFTDDDCTPAPDWLSRLVPEFGTADVVQGRTLANPDQLANTGPFSRTLEVEVESPFYETCNIAYRRSLLESLGGFDEDFRHPFGEDTDLGWRAREAGATTAFVPDAVVYHDVWPSEFGASVKELRRKAGIVRALSKHPALRREVGWGTFYHPSHGLALAVAAAGLSVLSRPASRPRWATFAALAARYAWYCRWNLRTPKNGRFGKWGWVGVVPANYVLDLGEFAVLARASARYRTLLL